MNTSHQGRADSIGRDVKRPALVLTEADKVHQDVFGSLKVEVPHPDALKKEGVVNSSSIIVSLCEKRVGFQYFLECGEELCLAHAVCLACSSIEVPREVVITDIERVAKEREE